MVTWAWCITDLGKPGQTRRSLSPPDLDRLLLHSLLLSRPSCFSSSLLPSRNSDCICSMLANRQLYSQLELEHRQWLKWLQWWKRDNILEVPTFHHQVFSNLLPGQNTLWVSLSSSVLIFIIGDLCHDHHQTSLICGVIDDILVTIIQTI